MHTSVIFCANHDCIGPDTTAANLDDAIVQWNTRHPAAPAQSKHSNVPVDAIVNLVNHQTQCDEDGVMVQVSRQALAEVLIYVTEVRPDNKWADKYALPSTPQASVEGSEQVAWRVINGEPFEYAIQRGPHGDEFVKLLSGECLRRPAFSAKENLRVLLEESRAALDCMGERAPPSQAGMREALEAAKAAMLRTRTASIAGCNEGYGKPELWAEELFRSHGDLTKAIKLCETALASPPSHFGQMSNEEWLSEIRRIVNILDDVEVGADDRCAWGDVANAGEKMLLELKALTPPHCPGATETEGGR